MASWLSFEGGLDRRRYALAATVAFFAQYAVVGIILALRSAPAEPVLVESEAPAADGLPWWFWFNPLRAFLFHQTFLGESGSVSPAVWSLGLLVALLANAALVVLSYRRAMHAGRWTALAAVAVVPVAQIGAIVLLALASPKTAEAGATSKAPAPFPARAIALGLLAGVALCTLSVLLSALVFRSYGYSLFLLSPFIAGLTIAYIVNRGATISLGATNAAVMAGMALGGLALLALAIEGVICIVLASPLISFMGFLGGLAGRMLANAGRPRGAVMSSVAVLPLALVAEALLPPSVSFETVERIEVAASPEAVWRAVTNMGTIPDPPSAPFRWGLAYPIAGEIEGAGVGAIRRGVFSTGVAYEEVTVWEPPSRLSFVVLSDPPTLKELSPYAEVHAPHLLTSFKTLDARFAITPLPDGGSELSLATAHELRLEPALYWALIARWVTHANKVRVLEHFRDLAEAEEQN